MAPELTIRITDLRDPEVTMMLAELPWGTEGIDADEFDAPRGAVVVAARDVPLGCCAVRPFSGGAPAQPGRAVGEIKRLYVREPARGEGLARALLAEIEEIAAELGYDELRLDTAAAGPVGLFASAGYSPIARYNDNEYAVHFFTKALA